MFMALKEMQVNAVIVDIFFAQYLEVLVPLKEEWAEEDLLGIWEVLPFRNLEEFLDKLGLRQAFTQQDKQKYWVP